MGPVLSYGLLKADGYGRRRSQRFKIGLNMMLLALKMKGGEWSKTRGQWTEVHFTGRPSGERGKSIHLGLDVGSRRA